MFGCFLVIGRELAKLLVGHVGSELRIGVGHRLSLLPRELIDVTDGSNRAVVVLTVEFLVFSLFSNLSSHLGVSSRAAMRGTGMGSQSCLSDIGDGGRCSGEWSAVHGERTRPDRGRI